jgi:ABC-type polar amino acid transport system ATPase subunit
MLKLTGLHKSFGHIEVLKGVDLEVPEGSVVAIIGVSGSGKSTILRCVDFLETPDAGAITLDGRSFDAAQATKDDIQYMRRHTAMVFQLFHLFKFKTALENVTEGLTTVRKVPKAQARAQALELLDRVGLSDRVDHFPNQLSGGQQQRVAIARSLALNPKVMLLDEPTSALDPEMIAEVLEVIREVAREGRTMVIVSHEMNFVYEIADQVVLLHEGEIIEQGTPQEVFGAPKTERGRQFISRVSLTADRTVYDFDKLLSHAATVSGPTALSSPGSGRIAGVDPADQPAGVGAASIPAALSIPGSGRIAGAGPADQPAGVGAASARRL